MTLSTTYSVHTTEFFIGPKHVHNDWALYKNLIGGGLYLNEHPTNEPIAISVDRKGFESYHGHMGLLNMARLHLQNDKNPPWLDF